MKILRTILSIRDYIAKQKRSRHSIGFVPTMGSLHEGHLSLVKASQKECDKTIVSIFVNPLQFGEGEDFDVYPREEKDDLKLLEREKVDAVFIPSANEMYGDDFLTYVNVSKLPDVLCGKSRPGHFKGVCTVVLKLLNIVTPDKLFLGQKDAQQAIIIKKMIQDLNLDVKTIVCPIIRDKDGLALSSRNKYLTENQRQDALFLNKALKNAQEFIEAGEKQSKVIEEEIKKTLEKAGNLVIDYIAILDYNNLIPLDIIGNNTLIAVAVYVGETRLIDNVAAYDEIKNT